MNVYMKYWSRYIRPGTVINRPPTNRASTIRINIFRADWIYFLSKIFPLYCPLRKNYWWCLCKCVHCMHMPNACQESHTMNSSDLDLSYPSVIPSRMSIHQIRALQARPTTFNTRTESLIWSIYLNVIEIIVYNRIKKPVRKFGGGWKFGHTNYLRNSNLFVKILFIHGYHPEVFLH